MLSPALSLFLACVGAVRWSSSSSQDLAYQESVGYVVLITGFETRKNKLMSYTVRHCPPYSALSLSLSSLLPSVDQQREP
jgi:hypothetical protein